MADLCPSITDFIAKLPEWLTQLSNAITWPLVAIVAFWCLRDEIKKLIPRLRVKLPDGTVVGQAHAQSNDGASNPENPQIAPENKAIAATNQTIQILPLDVQATFAAFVSLEQLEPVVENFKNTLLQGIPEESKVDYLLYFSAALNIHLSHERNHNLLFGSQIFLLKKINENLSLTVDQARQIYDNAASLYQDFYKTYSFESWMNFLVSISLCTQHGTKLTLTPYGKGFLKYLIDFNLPEGKPY